MGLADTFVPGVGTLTKLALGQAWGAASAKRVDVYLEQVGVRLDAIEDSIEGLRSSMTREVATSVQIAGAYAAVKTHDQDKLDYLADAAVRVTVDEGWDSRADFALLLMGLLDGLTATHIRMLAKLSARVPGAQPGTPVPGVAPLPLGDLPGLFPGLEPVVAKGVAGDLMAKGLLGSVDTFLSSRQPVVGEVTDLGRELLALVKPVVR